VREHPEIETVLVGDGWAIYAKESTMMTVDDVDDEMLFRDEEAENVKEAVERVVRLRVDLAGIMLRTADPTDVYLEDVNFAGTGLRNTQLTAARLASDLKSAEFTNTVLRGSNLRTAELENIREDLWAVLSVASHEVSAIRAALVEGRIDGGTYYGECACLIGTIGNARGCDVYSLGSLRPAPDRPIEHLFMRLDRGDTPQTNPVAKLIVQWIDAWRTRFQHEHHKQESSSV